MGREWMDGEGRSWMDGVCAAGECDVRDVTFDGRPFGGKV